MRAAMVWGALGLGPAAWATEPVTLPASEDPQQWRVALELADLVVAPEGLARIRLYDYGARWVVEVRGVGGLVRTADVEAPRTGAARQEVAFLAQGLIRQVTVDAAAPAPLLAVRPPPPPPPPLVPAGSEPDVAPATDPPAATDGAADRGDITPPDAAEPDDADEGDGGRDDAGPDADPGADDAVDTDVDADADDPTAFEPPLATVLDLEPDRPSPPPRRNAGIGAPPMSLGAFGVVRAGVPPAFSPVLGLDLVAAGPLILGLDVGVTTARDLGLEFARNLTTVDVLADAATPVGDALEVTGVLGVSARLYRQEGNALDEATLPVLGAGAGWTLVRTGAFATTLDLRLLVDLGATVFELPNGEQSRLSPFELRLGLRQRFLGGRDPFPKAPTFP